MANVTGSSNTSTAMNVFIPDWTFVIISFIIAISAIILNSIEIHLILRKWKKATNFEVILFHLAIADFLSSIGSLITCIVLIYFLSIKSINTAYIWASFGILAFFYTVSVKIVLVIGIERLLAIKLPLKHRLWHMNPKTLYKQIVAAWFVSAIVIGSAVLSDYFIQKAKGKSSTGQGSTGQSIMPSRAVGYTLAGYLTFEATVVLVSYMWLLHVILVRATHLLNVSKEDYNLNPKIMKLAAKKEKATVVICWIVLVSFFACNMPQIVDQYRGKITDWGMTLSNLNAVLNPLIYFFKGFIEKRQSRKRLVTLHESVGSNSKHEVLPPNTRTISNEAIEVGITDKAANGDFLKSPGLEIGRSKNKGEDSSPEAGKSDALVKLFLSREVANEDEPKSTDQESERQRDKGQSSPSKLSKAELGFADKRAIVNEPLPYDEESGMSKDKGEFRSPEPHKPILSVEVDGELVESDSERPAGSKV